MNARGWAGAAMAAGSLALVAGGLGIGSTGAAAGAARHDSTTFPMVRSTAAVTAGCLAHAHARVRITPLEGAERMDITAWGLPKKTEFDVFVIQTPDAPFGLSWYQGDLETNRYGQAHQRFIGRFNEETFTVAPGSTTAPVVHHSPIADASSNPPTAPVHQYHLGVWFNSPDDAANAGCASTVTPFNGEHNAGVQALSTRTFPVDAGPLRNITP